MVSLVTVDLMASELVLKGSLETKTVSGKDFKILKTNSSAGDPLEYFVQPNSLTPNQCEFGEFSVDITTNKDGLQWVNINEVLYCEAYSNPCNPKYRPNNNYSVITQCKNVRVNLGYAQLAANDVNFCLLRDHDDGSIVIQGVILDESQYTNHNSSIALNSNIEGKREYVKEDEKWLEVQNYTPKANWAGSSTEYRISNVNFLKNTNRLEVISKYKTSWWKKYKVRYHFMLQCN